MSSHYEKKFKDAKERIHEANRARPRSHVRWVDLMADFHGIRTQQLAIEASQVRSAIITLGKRIQELHRALEENIRAQQDWQEVVKSLGHKDPRRCLEELERLRKLEQVLGCEVKGSQLIVYSDFVYIQHDRKCYKIAMYEITYEVSRPPEFRIMALCTTHPGNAIHPNQISGSDPGICFGNMKEKIRAAIRRQEWAVSTQFILTSLATTTYPNKLTGYELFYDPTR